MSVEERTPQDRLPARDAGEAPLLGNAYPGPVRRLEPGAFPSAGFDVQVSGPYYEVQLSRSATSGRQIIVLVLP
jgi:hypothetical protein